jgi:mycothiol synthase
MLRPFRGEVDLPVIGTLISACQAVDTLDQPESRQGLREELLGPTSGWTREIGLWESNDGLVGFATIWVPPATEIQDVYLWFIVHPSARDSDLAATVITWGDQLGGEHAGENATLTVSAGDDDRWRLALIPRFGFGVERYFLRMIRHLDQPLPELRIPFGYEIRPVDGVVDTEAWVNIYNHAFADHWEHINTTVQERQVEQSRESYRPHLDLVAVAPDGTFAGFCAGTIARHDDGTLEPWIALVGTHASHRRRGIARAMIAKMCAQLHAEGFTTVRLGVDAASPTSAVSVYESLGFTVMRRITVFRRPIVRRDTVREPVVPASEA